jgi:hypothetical protein
MSIKVTTLARRPTTGAVKVTESGGKPYKVPVTISEVKQKVSEVHFAVQIPYYTQAGLAEKAGVVRSAVYKAIERGILASVAMLDGVRVVAQADAEKWIEERAPSRRKAK